MLSLVRRKVWNHYFSIWNKAGNYQPFGTIPYHQNTQRILTLSEPMPVTTMQAELVFQGHILLGITQDIHWQLSQTPIIKHKQSVMLISRPTYMQRGFPSSQNSWLPFVLVSSSYSSLSFDYTAIRYANAWDPEKYFFKHEIVSNQAHSLLLYTQATH